MFSDRCVAHLLMVAAVAILTRGTRNTFISMYPTNEYLRLVVVSLMCNLLPH